MSDKETLPVTNYAVSAMHVDISTINPGDAVPCPSGWMPLGMAAQHGNDVVILLYAEV